MSENKSCSYSMVSRRLCLNLYNPVCYMFVRPDQFFHFLLTELWCRSSTSSRGGKIAAPYLLYRQAPERHLKETQILIYEWFVYTCEPTDPKHNFNSIDNSWFNTHGFSHHFHVLYWTFSSNVNMKLRETGDNKRNANRIAFSWIVVTELQL